MENFNFYTVEKKWLKIFLKKKKKNKNKKKI